MGTALYRVVSQQLVKSLKTFLSRHLNEGEALLLALSGGVDSIALLHLLLESRKHHFFHLHLAHIDHRWRDSSTHEAKRLQSYVSSLGLPFHLKTLEALPSSNLEDFGRQARYSFFRELSAHHSFQAVMTAHHNGDQAETVLKRLLEGSALNRLKGIQEVSQHKGLTLWRPLLHIKKQELINYAKQYTLPVIEDESNNDQTFLRARMRQTIIPQLETDFGKNITSALTTLAQESAQLDSYLKNQAAPLLKSVLHSSLGIFLKIPRNIHSYLLVYLLRSLCHEHDVRLSREAFQHTANILLRGDAGKQITHGSNTLHLDRHRLFILKTTPQKLPKTPLTLTLGKHHWGAWTVEIKESGTKLPAPSWQQLWENGQLRCHVPAQGSYHLRGLKESDKTEASSLSKRWQEYKVPSWLRHIVPILCCDDQIETELLSGKISIQENIKPEDSLELTLTYNR